MLAIKNGRVIDPATNTDAPRDILMEGEKIAEVAQPGGLRVAPGAEVFDAAGLIVAPGFIDLHAHLREPGQESSETIETGTKAAARGGFTAVCCMPNTKPVNDNASVTRFILDRAKATGSVRVWPIGAASEESKGEAIAEIAGMRDAGDGLLPVAGFAGDRARGRRLAGGGRGDARRSGIDEIGLARDACSSGVRVRCAGCAASGIDRRAAAHRASFGQGVAGTSTLGEIARVARDLRSDAAPLHAER